MIWYKLTKQVEAQPQPKLISNPTKIIEGIKRNLVKATEKYFIVICRPGCWYSNSHNPNELIES